MNSRLPLLKPIFLAGLLLLNHCGYLNAQTGDYQRQQARLLQKALEKNHYSPRTLDDTFSGQLFYRFIHSLDPGRLYLTEADIKTLSVYRLQLDNELKGSDWKFLPLATNLYGQRLLQAEKICTELLRTPFNFTTTETIVFAKKDSLSYAASEKEYQQRWNKWLTYRGLQQLAYQRNDSTTGGKTDTAREPLIRQKVLRTETRNIRQILDHPEGFEAYVGELFLNAITACFDPHTNYLSKTGRENYESGISTEAHSFGMNLDENQAGEVIISRLVPGGPAWKSGELHKDDVLLSLRWKGKNPVDLADAEVEEVEGMIQSTNSGQLELTVRKANGLAKTVSLVKEKIREDENIVKGYILKGAKKIGYISLPGFYTQWDNNPGGGCANDVAKEIVKLKQEKIDGLILDIRYNGGGSLYEGASLAGIFVNEGPLFMMQGRDRKPVVMKDMNRGTIYDGPLVLMVNGQSASASEVLASTLQDYNRALIVGSPTFGKATGQVIFPLDTTLNPIRVQQGRSKTDWGSATITVEKLYRVTGKSAQLKGVQPDVLLPDIFERLDYRESSRDFALSGDSVGKKVYYSPAVSLPRKDLAGKSTQRTNVHPSFQLIRKFTRRELLSKDNRTIPLNLVAYRKMMDETRQWINDLEAALERPTTLYSVENTGYDQELMRIDTYGSEINGFYLETLRNDIYLEEAYRVMQDLLFLTQSENK